MSSPRHSGAPGTSSGSARHSPRATPESTNNESASSGVDLVVRPKVAWRIGLHVLAGLFGWWGVADGSWQGVAAAVAVAVQAATAWRSVIVVIEPTTLKNGLSGWSELNLNELRRVEPSWGGKFPTRNLTLTDARDDTLWLASRVWWQSGPRRRLYAIIGKWARVAEADGKLSGKGRDKITGLDPPDDCSL